MLSRTACDEGWEIVLMLVAEVGITVSKCRVEDCQTMEIDDINLITFIYCYYNYGRYQKPGPESVAGP